ncbi:hypothetical protein V5O48_003050 [Marasmius crinis-equi]|uniref:Transcription factor CBF/NF-Y/archaeal histone domain-containing protein n=1 Tax=Marasmius crinis-equi TaxID=585013 RepID=A0ABR3FU04_9AGAR
MSNEETQMDTQEHQDESAQETLPETIPDIEPSQAEAEPEPDVDAAEEEGHDESNTTAATGTKAKKPKQPVQLSREPGKSLLPFSRVQKIIKADKDIPIIARDATFLISLATEEFIKRLCQEGQRIAEREKRSTVQSKDLATIVRKADEFMFLEEILSARPPEAPKRKPKALEEKEKEGEQPNGPTLLDHFAAPPKTAGDEGSQDVAMNEDGTMDVDPQPVTQPTDAS